MNSHLLFLAAPAHHRPPMEAAQWGTTANTTGSWEPDWGDKGMRKGQEHKTTYSKVGIGWWAVPALMEPQRQGASEHLLSTAHGGGGASVGGLCRQAASGCKRPGRSSWRCFLYCQPFRVDQGKLCPFPQGLGRWSLSMRHILSGLHPLLACVLKASSAPTVVGGSRDPPSLETRG